MRTPSVASLMPTAPDTGDNTGHNCNDEVEYEDDGDDDVEPDGDDVDDHSVLIEVTLAKSMFSIEMMTIMAIVFQL